MGPRFGSVTFCVATAPTPARACGQRAPTAIDEVVIATPKAPVFAQRPAMENVMASVRNDGGRFDLDQPLGPRQRRDHKACRAWEHAFQPLAHLAIDGFP